MPLHFASKPQVANPWYCTSVLFKALVVLLIVPFWLLSSKKPHIYTTGTLYFVTIMHMQLHNNNFPLVKVKSFSAAGQGIYISMLRQCFYSNPWLLMVLQKASSATQSWCTDLITGTGSGLGTRVLSLLEEEFPEVCRIVTSIYPSAEDDVITSPYNSVLAMRELTEHADCVLPVENQVCTFIHVLFCPVYLNNFSQTKPFVLHLSCCSRWSKLWTKLNICLMVESRGHWSKETAPSSLDRAGSAWQRNPSMLWITL